MWQILPYLWWEMWLNPWGVGSGKRRAPTMDTKETDDG